VQRSGEVPEQTAQLARQREYAAMMTAADQSFTAGRPEACSLLMRRWNYTTGEFLQRFCYQEFRALHRFWQTPADDGWLFSDDHGSVRQNSLLLTEPQTVAGMPVTDICSGKSTCFFRGWAASGGGRPFTTVDY
jgi:hypothetical protein